MKGDRRAPTIGNVGDLTKYVVPADLFIPFWWADQRLADHSDVDFGTDTSVCGLEVERQAGSRFSAAPNRLGWRQTYSRFLVVHGEVAHQPRVGIVFVGC